eukprot:7583615-Alexandrium_andersonii.AAC.1
MQAAVVHSTSHLVHRASDEMEVAPCFWARGLVPSDWYALPRPPSIESETPCFHAGAFASQLHSGCLWDRRLWGLLWKAISHQQL